MEDATIKVLGRKVKVTLKGVKDISQTTVYDGVEVFAFDRNHGLVVFRNAHAHTYQKADYFFVPVVRITEIVDLGEGSRMPINNNIGVEVLKARFAVAKKEEERKIECYNADATEFEQKIFSELLKSWVTCHYFLLTLLVFIFSYGAYPLLLIIFRYPRAKWGESGTIILDDQGLKLKRPYTLKEIVGESSFNLMNETGKKFLEDSLSKARLAADKTLG